METERGIGLNPPVSSGKKCEEDVLICEQLSSVLLKAQSSAEYAGTVVAERQQVLASIIDATRDVGHQSRHRFCEFQQLLQTSAFKDPETPDYTRSPVDTERVLGLDRRG